jgi:hypothetical protein
MMRDVVAGSRERGGAFITFVGVSRWSRLASGHYEEFDDTGTRDLSFEKHRRSSSSRPFP